MGDPPALQALFHPTAKFSYSSVEEANLIHRVSLAPGGMTTEQSSENQRIIPGETRLIRAQVAKALLPRPHHCRFANRFDWKGRPCSTGDIMFQGFGFGLGILDSPLHQIPDRHQTQQFAIFHNG